MGIEEFDPISQPKRLKSAAKLRALPENKKLVLDAVTTEKVKEVEEVEIIEESVEVLSEDEEVDE